MAASVKFSDVVSKFGGKKGEDASEWLKKVELVASLQGINELHKFIPLFLVDAAFSVYDELPEADKNSVESIKECLL